jgi:uncharacterized glyoxalase superfamily protein PhnB
LRKNVIHELDDNYFMVAHPFPQMEGELILYQPRKGTGDKKMLTFRDFSLKKRVKTTPKPTKPTAF